MVKPAPEFNKRMQIIREIVSEEARLELDVLAEKIADRVEERLRKQLEEVVPKDLKDTK